MAEFVWENVKFVPFFPCPPPPFLIFFFFYDPSERSGNKNCSNDSVF